MLGKAMGIKQLMQKAAHCKMSAVAMTDHGNIFGAIEFYREAMQAGIKPILGCEVYLTPPGVRLTEHRPDSKNRRNSHLTLLAQNNTGWHNLIKLVGKAHQNGFYRKPRIDKELLAEHSEGLICLSGCINGEINQLILQEQIGAARKSLEEFSDIFGREDFFLEIHDHGLKQQHVCTRQMVKFGKEFDLGLVAANDVHFIEQEYFEGHEEAVRRGVGSLQRDECRISYSPESYFKTSEEMAGLFKSLPEAICNTQIIADRCEVSMGLSSTSMLGDYPVFDPPNDLRREEYFRKLCFEGFRVRYGARADRSEGLKAHLDFEIDTIIAKGFDSYFLIIWDIFKWARDRGIIINSGRGTAGNCLVTYVLGITDFNPFSCGLSFSNFINSECVSPPEINIGLCLVRRDEVIEYMQQKYGKSLLSI